jgi:hypothetical protein
MRKFADYPIRINYNLHTQLRSRPHEIQLHEAKKYEAERRLSIKTNTSSDANLENGMYRQEIDQYEKAVYDCLVGINRNPVGRMVLGLINKSTTVWIIPRSAGDMKQCTCAQTSPLNYEIPKDGSYATGAGFGDTVIRFVPELGDDTLLHELVHAYRYSHKRYNPIEIDVRLGNEAGVRNIEEFLAHEMENIYMSQDHRPLTLDYKWASVSDKKTIYDFLVANTETLQTLKLFLHREDLAKRTAQSFTTDYNPFRDYKQLEGRFLTSAGLTELPELGAIVNN